MHFFGDFGLGFNLCISGWACPCQTAVQEVLLFADSMPMKARKDDRPKKNALGQTCFQFVVLFFYLACSFEGTNRCAVAVQLVSQAAGARPVR